MKNFLRRMFDGHIDHLKVSCKRWRRELEVSYGLFSDGHDCLKIKIDDVLFRGKSVLSETRKMPKVMSLIEEKAWEEAEHRAEMILFRRWENKFGDGSRSGEIIKKALSKTHSKTPA